MLNEMLAATKHCILMAGVRLLKPFVMRILIREKRVWGDPNRLIISPTASVANTMFNTVGGKIIIGDYTFTGHNVSILTGTHNYNNFLSERLLEYPNEGRDVIIGRGVWIGSNATIIGPCEIGDHAVIGAGAVVVSDVPQLTVFAGVPAEQIKRING